MALLIISGILLILAFAILIIAWDDQKRTYKEGPYLPIMLIIMTTVILLISRFFIDHKYSTSDFYVEKTTKTEIINNVVIKNDTLIQIKLKHKL